ncbi:MAG: hypothetical protein U9N33_08185 [Campylobacterota bacterium]|nr:hypothetical protein [Campylobacterota bacterium]
MSFTERKVVKTTIEIPLSISNEINNLLDRYDSSKCSTRQEFMLSAIICKIGSLKIEDNTEDKREVSVTVTENSLNETFNKFKGRF